MQAAGMEDRLAFAPPPPPGLLRAIVLAVIAHLLLVLALTLGLRWQRDAQPVAAEAELWSRLPQEAAPKPVPPPPPPPPPAPVVKAPPLPTPPQKSDADIALEREKARREIEREKQQALQREAEKREAAERKQAQLEKEKEKRRKLEAERKREEEEAERKQAQARKEAIAKRKEEEKRRKAEQEEKRLAKLREDNIRRSLNMATGSGSVDARGNAAQSSGPSASWGAKVQARVRPKIVFTETITGNPKAEVEVRTSPDGTIVGKRLVRSSGSKAWDDAVLRALDKTDALPRDTDGRVPSPVVIEFRPHG